MRVRLVVTATVIAAGSVGMARADDNFSIVVQDGSTHQGTIIQTGNGNNAGSEALKVTQSGVENYLYLTQSGDDNDIGLTGRGLIQTGTVSLDSARANSATIVQNSNGNTVGEIVQTTLGLHATTGNTLTLTEDLGDGNTITSIEQVAGDGASSNIASATLTGSLNWFDKLYQRTTSAEGDNSITLQVTGDRNGTNATQDGPGGLAVLAQGTGATPSALIQRDDISGGSSNRIVLTITGTFNQFGVEQVGTDNSVGAVVSGLSNSFAAYQLGRHNQVSTGGIAGDSNDMGIRQVGEANAASAVLHYSSSDNRIAIGQTGDDNEADIDLQGDDNIMGASQRGAEHLAEITVRGSDNVLLAVQANDGATASLRNSLTVTVAGSNNNALSAGSPQSFTGAALTASLSAALVPSSLFVAPDATTLLGAYGSNLLAVPGALIQWGEDNTIDIAVGETTASDGNLFSALQKGRGNTLVASIEGSRNQFVVLQQSDGNIAYTSQVGTNNLIGIRQ
jgi:hypothetical protein